jgi:hypothetical protein
MTAMLAFQPGDLEPCGTGGEMGFHSHGLNLLHCNKGDRTLSSGLGCGIGDKDL